MQIPMDSDGDVRMTNAYATPPPPNNKYPAANARAVPAPVSKGTTPEFHTDDLDDELYAQEVAAHVDTPDPRGPVTIRCDDPGDILNGIQDLFTQSTTIPFNTTAPPCAGQAVVCDRILVHVESIRRIVIQFGMPASVAFRASYMYAYLIQQDNTSIRIAKAFPYQFNCNKTVDAFLAMLCLYIVSDQVRVEVFEENIGLTEYWFAPGEPDHVDNARWLNRVHASAYSTDAGDQPLAISVDDLTDAIVPRFESDELVQQACTRWVGHQAMRLICLFGWNITGTLHPPSHGTGHGFSRGQWDPAMDTTASFAMSDRWTTASQWVSGQSTLMEDLANRNFVAYYLSVRRSEVSMAFQSRHRLLYLSSTLRNTNNVLLTAGRGLQAVKPPSPVRRPHMVSVCSVSS